MNMNENREILIGNRYRIKDTIGQGGMGLVYKVEDILQDNMPFALKTIKQSIFSKYRDIGINTFKNEYEIMTRLKHPNLTRVYEFLEDKGNYYIIMELLDGIILKDYNIQDTGKIMNIIVQILRALEYIHSRNIIYKDLKPSNIILCNERVKLLDFGLSGFKEKKERKLRGTLLYMPPDILLNNIGFSLDIFSLGIVFFEMICGYPYFALKDANINSILDILRNRESYDRHQENRLKNISDNGIRSIIEKMTKFCIKERYQICSSIIADINSICSKNYEYETIETKESYILGNSFANRTKEMQLLKENIFSRKRARLLLFNGSAGVGKTRLFQEFKKYCRLNSILFLESKCLEADAMPYHAFGQILKKLILFSCEDLLKKYGPYLKILFPDNRRLVSIKETDIIDDPKIMKDILLQNISDYIIEFARDTDTGLIFFFDDIHWIDEGSFDILELILYKLNIIDNVDIVLKIYANINENRSEINIKDHTYYEKIDLLPLKADAVSEYIGNIFGMQFIDDTLRKAVGYIGDRVGGNPLFLQELIRSMVEKGIIIKDKIYWKLGKSISEIDIPHDLMKILQERVDKLLCDDSRKKILQVLSIIRTDLSFEAVKEIIIKIRGIDTADIILELQRLEILNIVQKEENVFYDFNSSLVKNLIRKTIQDKKALSIFAGEILESIDAEKYKEEVAFQYLRGRNIKKAIEFYTICADNARSLYLYEKAIKNYNIVLRLIPEDEIKNRAEIIIKKAESLETIGKLDEAVKSLYEFQKSIKEHENRAILCRIYLILGRLLLLKGDIKLSKKFNEISLKISKELNDTILYHDSLANMGRYYFNQCDYQKAKYYYGECEKLCKNDKKRYAEIINNIGNINYILSRYSKALEYYTIARDIYKEIGDKKGYSSSIGNIGNVYRYQSKFFKAIEAYKIHENISREIGFKRGIGVALLNMGIAYHHLGEFEKAMYCYSTDLNICREIGDKRGMGIAYGHMGIIFKIKGEYDKALENYILYKNISEEIGDKQGIAEAIGNMGIVYFHQCRYEEALESYKNQEIISREIGFRQGESASIANMGNIYKKQGYFEKALICFERYKAKCEETEDKVGIGIAYANIGDVFSMLGKFKEALEFYNRYREISIEAGDKNGIGLSQGLIGFLYYDLKKFKEAYENIEKAIEIFDSLQIQNSFYIECLIYKSQLLLKEEKLFDSLSINNEALRLAIKLENPEAVFECNIQGIRINSLNDKEYALKSLLDLLSDELKPEQKASIYYEAYKLASKEQYRIKAYNIYRGLYEKSPLYQYKNRIEELKEKK